MQSGRRERKGKSRLARSGEAHLREILSEGSEGIELGEALGATMAVGGRGAVQLKCTSRYLCTRGHASSANVATDASIRQSERPEHL